VEPRTEEGSVLLIFADLEASAAQYSDSFEKRLQALLSSLAFPSADGVPTEVIVR
jgi:hypothetical protein